MKDIPAILPAISLWEPWATAMAFELKKNETRSWPTNYRGYIAICAAKRPMTRDDAETYDIFVRPHMPKDFAIHYGCVLCVVYLQDVITTDGVLSGFLTLPELEVALGDYSEGRYAWLTHTCRRLKEPVPVIGRQGIFMLPPDVYRAVRDQIT